MSTLIYHITSEAAAVEASGSGTYWHRSLQDEGFVHCSSADQLLVPANERYRGRSDLILLAIDPSALTGTLVVEDSYGTGMAFPHVYGPINWSAVVDTIAFPCRPDGGFDLPPGVQHPR